MKKILMLGVTANRGGVETYCFDFVKAVKGIATVVFLENENFSPSFFDGELRNNGAKVISEPDSKYLIKYLDSKKRAYVFLKNNEFDLVYINALTPNLAYWVTAAQANGIKCVYHSHNDQEISSSLFKGIISKLLKKHNQKIISRATTIACSKSAGKYMFGIDQPFQVINNSVDTDKWKFKLNVCLDKRSKLSIPKEADVMISVGRLSEQKNYVKMIEIMREFVCSNSNHFGIIVGDGVGRQFIQSKVMEYDIEDKIRIVGMVDDVENYMSASNVLVFPSIFEGLPFTLIEAQANGLPILVTKDIVPKEMLLIPAIKTAKLISSSRSWMLKADSLLHMDNDRFADNNLIASSSFSKTDFVCTVQKLVNEIL